MKPSSSHYAYWLGVAFRWKPLLVFLCVPLLLGQQECQPEGPTVPGTPETREMEYDAFNLINQERADYGLPALVMDNTLRNMARAHSQDMADLDYFSHVSPEGETLADRLADAGVEYSIAGENIAYNNYPDPAATAVEGWMNSDGHRANILNESFTTTGMGVAVNNDGMYYFTQDFTAQ